MTPRIAPSLSPVAPQTTRIVLLLALGLALAMPAPARAAVETIATDSGPVLRRFDGVYQGIPYASPPVGALRWRPPQPARPWAVPLACDAPGPQCPQNDADGDTAEDCLTLGLRTPARAAGDRLPVMVFFHGGAFLSGAGSLSLYAGEALAREGVVLVTVNYRLGALGFMAHPALSAESPAGVSGNYGLLDQQAALAWVRRNIAAFGGDPDNVTVFGQSAGAASVLAHLVSPAAAGLFHKAILQSPVAPGALRRLKDAIHGVASAEDIGRRIAARLGVDVQSDIPAALRAASAEDILAATEALRPEAGLEVAGIVCSPTVDGVVVPDHPLTLFSTGRQHHMPLIIGTTANESSLFLDNLTPPADTAQAYARLVTSRFGDDANRVLALAPGLQPGLWNDLERVVSTRWFLAPAEFLARAQAASGSPCFVCRYGLPPPLGALAALEDEGDALGVSPQQAGVPHGAELFPVFGFESPWLGFDDADRAVGKAMRSAWAAFARTGRPAVAGGPTWPRFDPAAPRIMAFGKTPAVKPLPWEPLVPLVERSWQTTTY
jgi:para-nitrobenzyl esterase